MSQVTVMGIVADDAAMASAIKKVVFWSAVLALLATLNFIVNISTGTANIEFPISNWLLGLAIPFCGFVGAKNRNKDLLLCFTVCTFCSAILSIVGIVLYIQALRWCNPFQDAIEEINDTNAPVCYYWQIYTAIAILAMSLVVASCASYAGSNLRSRTVPIVVAVPQATVVSTVVQPAAQPAIIQG